jgi:hypothetical protein
VLHHYPIPEDLSGKRCLDVATMDGFWAFEMERRGAASVTALDLEDPDELDWPASLALRAARPRPPTFLVAVPVAMFATTAALTMNVRYRVPIEISHTPCRPRPDERDRYVV